MPTKPQDPRPAFGSEVRRRRLAARWTIEQLAARAGISPNYLGAIERGIRDPSVSVIQAIAGGLGITVAELLGGEVKQLTEAGLEMARMFDEAPERVQDGLLQILRNAVPP
jgi:transcriptional regulator with XRE-family HTH domain